LKKAYFPLPVFLNRLAADRFVLIFGISNFSYHESVCAGFRMIISACPLLPL
jgi:hypothetical protein